MYTCLQSSLTHRKVVQERPYLTESGAQVYTRLCVLLCSPYSDLDVVTEQHVLYQCQYVLIGIPTSIFQFDKVGYSSVFSMEFK